MPCSILIRATDSPSGGMKKGYLSVVTDLPHTWGAMEGMPNWIHVDISDADASEVESFLANWMLFFEVTTVQDIAPRARLRFKVHPSVISASGTGRNEIKAEMSAWAVNDYGASIVNNSISYTLIDFPKPLTGPGGAVTIADITADFADRFNVMFDRARYYVAVSDVDTVIGAPNNGDITITKSEALATVNDKFLD